MGRYVQALPGALAPTARMSRAEFCFAALRWLGVATAAVQVALAPTYVNIISAALALAPSLLTFAYLQRSRAFEETPLSAFSLLGLTVTLLWGALVAQTFALTPISDSLRDAVSTFAWLAGYQCVAVLAHLVYARMRAVQRARHAVSELVFRPLALFSIPSPGMLWLFGLLGMFAQFVSGAELDSVEVGKKFLDAFRFLAWAPFTIIVMHRRYGRAYCDLRKQTLGLAFYVLLAIAIGMAVNARSVMFSGITTAALLFFMLALGDRTPMNPRQAWRLAPLALLGVLAVGYGSDLATAMVLARGQRGNITPTEMLEQTAHALLDRRAIQAYQEFGKLAARFDVYDEHYITNPIVARFVETKFHDNMLFLVEDLPPIDKKVLREDARDRVFGILPEPVLRQLGLNADKSTLLYSSGDLLDFLRYGNELGGMKKGSIFANLNGMFGPYAIPIYFLICVATFFVWDLMSLARRPGEAGPQLATIAMLSSLSLFVAGLSMESLSNIVALWVRGLPQSVLFYALLFWLSSQVFKPFKPPVPATPVAALAH